MDPIKENVIETEKEVEVEVVKAPQISAFEVKARQKGWLSAEELKEKQGDEFNPDNVVNARQFVEKGEMIGELNRLKKQNKGFEDRLSNNNEYWKSQLEIQKSDLIDKRNEAIDLADKDEVNKIDGQIKNIEQQEDNLKPAAQQFDPVDTQIENDYLYGIDSIKQRESAINLAKKFISEGYVGTELVDAIKGGMSEKYPATNPLREKATLTTSKSRSKSPSEKTTIDNISANDKLALSAMRRVSSKYAKKSDAEMIKILEDSKR